MSKQTDYSSEEWKLISAAPVMAGLLVSVSDISSPLGMAKEAIAIVKGVNETAAGTSNELINGVSEGILSRGGKPDMPDLPNDKAGLHAALIDGCKRAADLVTQKSPAEAVEYKNWLVTLAKRTAEATKEGGFLGFGGTPVSEAENTAVSEVARALGVSA